MSRIYRWLSVCAVLSALNPVHAQPLEVVLTAPQGSQLKGLTAAESGSVYAVLAAGGAHNQGAVVRRDADGALTVLHSFGGFDGAQPSASVIVGADDALYGTTASGGANGYGTIYRLTPSGSLSTLHHFEIDDGGPSRAPLLLADDGNLWGVTWGIYKRDCFEFCTWEQVSSGRVFKLAPDGRFDLVLAGLIEPSGGLIQTSTGDLYGVQPRVLAPGRAQELVRGDVYRIAPDSVVTRGSGLHHIDFNPQGELLEASDGYLYGVSTYTYQARGSRVFRLSTDSEYGDIEYRELGYEAQAPGGIAFGGDGNLYGAAEYSGFFRLTTAGVKTHVRSYDAVISPPTAAMRFDGKTGFYVGSSENLSRLEQSGAASVLHTFGFQQGDVLDSVTMTRDGTLYGVTDQGGEHGAGTLFRVDRSGKLAALHHFARRGWNEPPLLAPIVEAEDGKLYTLTYEQNPQLVRLDFDSPDHATLAPLRVFESGVRRPRWLAGRESLLAGANGTLYGTIGLPGGPIPLSALYRYDPNSDELRELAFTDASHGPLLRATNGLLYGLTRIGSSGPTYEWFSMTPEGVMSHLHFFRPEDHVPGSDLAEGPDGSIYLFAHGPANAASALFRWTPDQRLEEYFSFPSESMPEYPVPWSLAVADGGEIYMSSMSRSWPSGYSRNIVISASGELQPLPAASLGTVVGADRAIYRIAPLQRDGYNGFRVEPLP